MNGVIIPEEVLLAYIAGDLTPVQCAQIEAALAAAPALLADYDALIQARQASLAAHGAGAPPVERMWSHIAHHIAGAPPMDVVASNTALPIQDTVAPEQDRHARRASDSQMIVEPRLEQEPALHPSAAPARMSTRRRWKGSAALHIKAMIELPAGLLWGLVVLLLSIRLLDFIIAAPLHALTQPALAVMIGVMIIFASINFCRRCAIALKVQSVASDAPHDAQSPVQAVVGRATGEHSPGGIAAHVRRRTWALLRPLELLTSALLPPRRTRFLARWQRALHMVVALSVLTLGFAAPIEGKDSPLLTIFGSGEGERPPPVPEAAFAQPYAGQEIVYLGLADSKGAALDATLARRFERDTGIRVRVIPRALSATENYATYQRLFHTQSHDIDVYALDIVWMHAFAPYLVDLAPKLGEAAKAHVAGVVQNSVVDGRLVAMPRFDNLGLLYYRSDLLRAYGYDRPPQTWDELEEMARTIQAGERAGGNANFWGFIWQGAPYEGLTCNALEWIASQGGGTIIENGRVTIDNGHAVRALLRAQRWIGTISPQDVTVAKEEDSRQVFQKGNAAFMRHWPYAYASLRDSNTSAVPGKFDVAPLPHNLGQARVGVVGGDQLGVSSYSRHPDAAIEFVRYMTSPEVQKWRAAVGAYIPTIQAVQDDPEVHQMLPFLKQFQQTQRVTRPSDETGTRYYQASTSFFLGVNRVLFGADAATIVQQIEQDLRRDLPTPQPAN